jgi:hypothetical protein
MRQAVDGSSGLDAKLAKALTPTMLLVVLLRRHKGRCVACSNLVLRNWRLLILMRRLVGGRRCKGGLGGVVLRDVVVLLSRLRVGRVGVEGVRVRS